ncbi:uncharacterized protein LOC115985849 [Quercus lobata]|uniref:uncharacterized protein LOC115985849 n=1 Tax=Quercus lobata TaxID=97700 RepID=UPI001247EBC4|nr:uncharacterized protein LOC115985849 [Quercus lobata]
MSREERVQVLLFLVQNVDVFTWDPYEVPGVDLGFIVHKLNVDPSYPLKKQKPRRSAKDHVEAVIQEVEKLKEAGAIRETFFPEWMANTIVVRKKNGKWKLKNAGATYQQMMTRMFRDKMGDTIKVYIEDMVVKSKQEARHVEDFRGVFEVLRKHRLRLNAEKCAFGVGAGKFLGT